MKKTSLFYSLLFIASVIFLGSCGKKDDEPTPSTPDPETKVFELQLNDNSKETKIEGVISTSDGTAIIRLNVVSTTNLDRIFILKSEDNGDLKPITVQTITTSDGKKFDGGS